MIFSCSPAQARGFYNVRFPYSPAILNELKLYPGPRWDPQARVWLISKELTNSLNKLGKWRLPQKKEFPPIDFPSGIREFQKLTLENIQRESSWLISYETGLGKTPVSIWGLRASLEKTPGKTLIVCPGPTRNQWKHQVTKFAEEYSECVKVAYEVPELVDGLLQEDGITITSPELLSRANPSLELDNIIVDESQCIKNPKAQITKTLLSLARKSTGLRLCLSATPIGNEVVDIWSQLDFLWPERFGSYWKFINFYGSFEEIKGTNRQGEAFEAKKFSGLNIQREVGLRERLSYCHERVSLGDPAIAAQVPAIILDTIRMRVEHQHAKAEIPGENDQGALAFDVMRQHQQHVENQQLKFTSSRVSAAVELANTEAGYGKSLCLVTYHPKTAQLISDGLRAQGIRVELLVAAQSDIVREDKAKTIIMGGGVLVVSMKLINKGVDYLKNFDLAYIVELYWSPEVMLQLLGRFRRIGGKVVVVKMLIIENSLDEPIAMEIERKINEASKLMDSIDVNNNLTTLIGGAPESDEEWAKRLSSVANAMGIDGYGEYNFEAESQEE